MTKRYLIIMMMLCITIAFTSGWLISGGPPIPYDPHETRETKNTRLINEKLDELIEAVNKIHDILKNNS